MPVGEPLKLDLERSFSNPCSWNFRVGSKKQTIWKLRAKIGAVVDKPSVWQASDFVCFQEKDYKKHQYYLWLLDGGTKEYDEIEDEDEVT